MRNSAMLVAVALMVSFEMQPILEAQSKPAPVPQPPPSGSDSAPVSTVNQHLNGLGPVPARSAPLSSKIGRGSIYIPEIHVPREPLREYHEGMDALQKNDIKSAEQHLLRASELYPKFSSAFNSLGIAYELDADKQDKATGHNPAAKDAFRHAVALNPFSEKALANLGFVLIKENSSAEAERVLRTAAVESGTTRTYVLLMLAQALQHHYDDVLITAQHIRDGEEEQFPLVYFLRAVAWDAKSNFTQAANDYRQFLKLSPEAQEAPSARAALVRLGAN